MKTIISITKKHVNECECPLKITKIKKCSKSTFEVTAILDKK